MCPSSAPAYKNVQTASQGGCRKPFSHFLVRSQIGQTATHIAALHGNLEALTALLDCKADPSIRNERGATPLHFAATAKKNAARCCSVLLERGADAMLEDTYGRVPFELTEDNELRTLLGGPSLELHEAAKAGDVEAIRKLVGDGLDVSGTDSAGRTPLHIAVDGMHSAAASLLLQLGAEAGVADEAGLTPLHVAVIKRHAAALYALLDAPGVDVNAVTAPPARPSFTGPPPCAAPLHIAVDVGDAAAVAALLRAGADANLPDGNGFCALHAALEADNLEILGARSPCGWIQSLPASSSR